MSKRQAKREACFRASLILDTALDSEKPERFSDEEWDKVLEAMKVLIRELDRRGVSP